MIVLKIGEKERVMTVDRKQRVINEVWSAITHGVGAALGIWMLVLLILKGAATHDLKTIMAFIVYGTSIYFRLCFIVCILRKQNGSFKYSITAEFT